MAAQADDPVVQRRRLRTELRALRRKTKATQEQVAKALDWSTSKVLRIENGDVRVAPSDVRVLALHYGLNDKRRIDQLVEMARAARGDSWPDFKDIYKQVSLNFFAYEAAASLIRSYDTSLLHGVLQTEEYAKELLAKTFGEHEDEIERRWEIRLRRQEILERANPPEMFFIVDEGAVRRVIGSPRSMCRQLERLLELGADDRITIRVIPYSAGAHPGLVGPFVLLEFPDPKDDDVLFIEHVDGDKVIRDEPDVTADYTQRFFDLEKIALTHEETRDLLQEIIADLSGTKRTGAPQAVAAKT